MSFLYPTTRHSVYAGSWGRATLPSQGNAEEKRQGWALPGWAWKKVHAQPQAAACAWTQVEDSPAEPHKYSARGQGGPWSHQGMILEPTSISGSAEEPKATQVEPSGAPVHTWGTKKATAGILFWLPHREERENPSHRQSFLPKVSLALPTSLTSPSSWIYEKEKENYNKSKCFPFPFIRPEISNQRSTKSLLEPKQASNVW